MTRNELIAHAKMKEDLSLSYREFLKVIFDFQIKSRFSYLQNFIVLFKKVDSDNNGILSEKQFLEMLKLADLYPDSTEEQLERVLSKVDPFNTKQITFSDSVNFLSEVDF